MASHHHVCDMPTGSREDGVGLNRHTMDVSAEVAAVLRRVLRDLLPILENRESTSIDSYECLVTRIEVLHRQLNQLSYHYPGGQTLIDIVKQLGELLQCLYDLLSDLPATDYQAATTVRDGPGRPRYAILEEHILHLVNSGFTCLQISQMLGVSLRTVRRRMEGFNIRVSDTYSTLSDTELDRLITDIQNDFPNSGYTMMAGHLLARGHRVQQIRIRESMIRIDPDGVASRWFRSIQRRSY